MKKLFYNSLIRYGIQSYMKYCETSFNSFLNVGIDTTESVINLPIAVLTFLFVLGYPIFTYKFMKNRV